MQLFGWCRGLLDSEFDLTSCTCSSSSTSTWFDWPTWYCHANIPLPLTLPPPPHVVCMTCCDAEWSIGCVGCDLRGAMVGVDDGRLAARDVATHIGRC